MHSRALVVLFAALSIAGCAGGSLGPAAGEAKPLPLRAFSAAPRSATSVVLALPTIEAPNVTPVFDRRFHEPNDLSPATHSIAGSVGSIAFGPIALTASTPGCTPGKAGGLSCTLTLAATPGPNQTVGYETFASTNGSGSPLAKASTIATISGEQKNYVAVQPFGLASALYAAPQVPWVTQHQWADLPVVTYGVDAAGSIIPSVHVLGPAGKPIGYISVAYAGLWSQTVVGHCCGLFGSFLYNGIGAGQETFSLTANGLPRTQTVLGVRPPARSGAAPILASSYTSGIGHALTTYASGAGGDAAPISAVLLAGSLVAQTSAGDIWMLGANPSSPYNLILQEYDANFALLTQVPLPATAYGSGVALNPQLGEVAVLDPDFPAPNIAVYAVAGTGTHLQRTIDLPGTSEYQWYGVAIGTGGDVFVVRGPNRGGGHPVVFDYPPSGNGAVPPLRELAFPQARIGSPATVEGIATDSIGRLYVLESPGDQSVLLFTFEPHASVGKALRLPLYGIGGDAALAADARGDAFVIGLSAPSSQLGTILEYPHGARQPSRTIGGPSTELRKPDFAISVPQ